jgi:2-(1,2-epoxy-1,2-dihydrophenyl)acetyl-CoA isomerase
MKDSIEIDSAEFMCEREDNVAVLTLGANAFEIITDLTTKNRFIQLLDEVEDSVDIRGLALIDTGSYPGAKGYRKFLESVMAGGELSRGSSGLRVSRYGNALSQIALRLCEFTKPIVGGMSGVIGGEHFGMMLPCDFRIATTNVSFAFPNVPLGFPPTGTLVFYLLQNCGQAKTTEILYSSKSLEAEEALKLGLLTRIVSQSELREHCIDQLQTLAKLPGEAFAATRRLIQPDPLELRRFLDRSQETLWRTLIKMQVVE